MKYYGSSIFTITTVQPHLEAKKIGVNKSRTWGYFTELDVAKEFVIENRTDLNEHGYWPYIVIEEVKEGIIYGFRDEYWFVFNELLGKYESCNKPEELKSVVCWSMG